MVSAAMAREGAAYIVDYSLRDVHPPLYYLVLWLWLGLAGPSFPAARWTALAGGLVAVAAMTSLVRRCLGGRAAGYALALLVVAPAAVLFGATVRDFALGMALSALSGWALIGFRSKRPRRTTRAILLVAATAAALLTWYLHLAVWIVQLIYALRTRSARVGLLLGAGLAAPWYALVVVRLQPGALASQFGAAGGEPPGPGPFLVGAGQALVGSLPGGGSPAWLLPLWLAGGIAGGAALVRAGRRGLAALLAGGAALGLVSAWAVYRYWIGSEALTRFFLVAGFFGAALLAAALSRMPRWAGGLAACVPIIAGLLFYRDYLGVKVGDPPREALAGWLEARTAPADLIASDDLADLGYLWLARAPGGLALYHSHAKSYLVDRDPARLERALDAPAAPERAIWRVRWDEPVDENRLTLDAALLARFRPRAAYAVAGRQVAEFRGAPEWGHLSARFGDAIVLDAASLPDRAPSGAALPVGLRWQAVAPVDGDYKVFVHLLAGDGALLAQDDSPPGAGLRPTSAWRAGTEVADLHWLPLPPSAPAGRYAVEIGLYRGDLRLPLDGGGNALRIGEVTVDR